MAKLKAKLNQEEFDALEEAHQGLYVKGSDGFLLDAEGVEDVSGLKSALRRQTEENKTVKEKFAAQTEQIKDIDLEKAREALKKVDELEDKALMTEGKTEELVAKRLESVLRDHKAQTDALQKEIKVRDGKVETYEKRLSQTSLTAMIAKAAPEEKVEEEWLDYLDLRARQEWRLDAESGNMMLYDKDGTAVYRGNEPVSMNQWIAEIAKTKPKMLKPSSGGGATGDGGRRNGGSKDIILTPEQLNNPQEYQRMKALAEKQGGTVFTQ